jgi:hypothetical protein
MSRNKALLDLLEDLNEEQRPPRTLRFFFLADLTDVPTSLRPLQMT